MQTLFTPCAKTLLKLVDPPLPFLQRRPAWGPSARLVFLKQVNQGSQELEKYQVKVKHEKAQ